MDDKQNESDAAQAFDALRQAVEDQNRNVSAELTLIRKGVEGAFDQLETLQKPSDHSMDLGQIKSSIAAVGEQLETIVKAKALNHGPEEYGRIMGRAGETLVREAVNQLEGSSRSLKNVAKDLTKQTGNVRTSQKQNRQVKIAAAGGFLVALALLFLLPRLLPFEVDTYVAAGIIGKDRWESGADLMQAAEPQSYRELSIASRILNENNVALSKCGQAAQRENTDQTCTIIVTPAAAAFAAPNQNGG